MQILLFSILQVHIEFELLNKSTCAQNLEVQSHVKEMINKIAHTHVCSSIIRTQNGKKLKFETFMCMFFALASLSDALMPWHPQVALFLIYICHENMLLGYNTPLFIKNQNLNVHPHTQLGSA